MAVITKKVFIRVGRDANGEPAIEAVGEGEVATLGDSGNVDIDEPYRDFAVAVTFEPAPERTTVDEQDPVGEITAPPIEGPSTAVSVEDAAA